MTSPIRDSAAIPLPSDRQAAIDVGTELLAA